MCLLFLNAFADDVVVYLRERRGKKRRPDLVVWVRVGGVPSVEGGGAERVKPHTDGKTHD